MKLSALAPILLVTAFAQAAEVYLDKLDAPQLSCGWEGRDTQLGKSVAGKPMTLGTTVYTRGFGTHAPSEGVIQLDGKAERFTAVVGVDASEKPGTVRFIVKGDGKVLFDSGVMSGADKPKILDIPVRGVRKLTLTTTDGGDNAHNDHADWADAKITYSGATPRWVDPAAAAESAEYPSKRTPSAGNTTRYVDPVNGDDSRDGLSPQKAMRSFAGINALTLAPGDTVMVAPGTHGSSLVLEGAGTAAKPITVRFLKGKHIFAHGALYTEKLHISNTNDRPNGQKAIALRLRGASHVNLVGDGTEILAEGKMLYTHVGQSKAVTFSGLTFDYITPTVTEFTVTETTDNTATLRIAKDSTYRVEKGRLIWTGPGWEFPAGGYTKALNPKTGEFVGGINFSKITAEETAPRTVKFTYAEGGPRVAVGTVLQARDITRDCAGFFLAYSKDVTLKNCAIHAIHGMGVVSQFTENITFDTIRVEPRAGSDRTAVCWADILHFSGCRGLIRVKDCVLSCAHDDAINVHGTHLRIVGQPAPDKLTMRFIHGQSYGFEAFFPGDDVDFIRHDALTPFGTAKVKSVRRLDDRQIELTLDRAAPSDIRPNDVLENATWTAGLHVSGTTVRNIPTRAFLITTRQPVLVENCRFERTSSPAILLEDDASGWFESGFVRNLTIRNNTFVRCGEPVIASQPQVKRFEKPVHSGLVIEGNTFDLRGGTAVRTRHTADVKVGANTYLKDDKAVPADKAVDVK